MKEMGLAEQAARLDDAALMLPQELGVLITALPQSTKAQIREIRLRCTKPLSVNLSNIDMFINRRGDLTSDITDEAIIVTSRQIDECFKRICDYSVYSHQNEIIGGFITVKNGHRAGLCGSAVIENGSIIGVRSISSINLRVARQIFGAADDLVKRLLTNRIDGVLICGVPGSGKTTLLRDTARQLSVSGKRVSVVDERGEIAAVYCGQAGNDLGPRCDILDGYPKGDGILIAVRCLAPDVIVCDEIGSTQEADALLVGMNCGVAVIATVHAANREELLRKKQIMRLIEAGAFRHIVFLYDASKPCAIREVVSADELYTQGGGNGLYCGDLLGSGVHAAKAFD